MKKILWGALWLCSIATLAWGETPSDPETGQKLFAQIDNLLLENVPFRSANNLPLVVQLLPSAEGTRVSRDVDFQSSWTNELQFRQYRLHRLCDRLPGKGPLFTDKQATLFSVYKRILAYGTVQATTPNNAEDEKHKQAMHILHRRLSDVERMQGAEPTETDSPTFRRYKLYRDRYLALEGIDEFTFNLLKPNVPLWTKYGTLKDARNGIYSEWETDGSKQTVETAQDFLTNQAVLNPTRNWSRMRARLRESVLDSISFGEIPQTYTSPTPEEWSAADGWFHGQWNIADGLSISVELKFVTILRPWFSSEVLLDPKWQWIPMPGLPGDRLISTGNNADSGVAEACPMYAIGFILSRNIVLRGSVTNLPGSLTPSDPSAIHILAIVSQQVPRCPVP